MVHAVMVKIFFGGFRIFFRYFYYVLRIKKVLFETVSVKIKNTVSV